MTQPDNPTTSGAQVDVAIIGAGFGGLAAVHHLRQRGIRDIAVIERGQTVGGTWRDNTYPGAACDVPSHLYSLSFAPNPDWTRTYSRQGEIQQYLEDVGRLLEMDRITRFDTELRHASWDEANGRWRLSFGDEHLTARFLISAAGALADPTTPDLPGLADFPVPTFHSARWNHDVDLTGKRVALVGTGASAIQILPELQPVVGRLHLLQRTPPWIVPRTDRPITNFERSLYRRLPATQSLVRAGVYASREATVLGFLNPRFSGPAHRLATTHLRRQIRDRQLRDRLTPDYTIGCKRILMSNTYYPAVAQDNVEVLDALSSVDGDCVVTSAGDRRQVDALIFCTGFQVQDMPVAHRIVNAAGETLHSHVTGGRAGLMGTTFSGFPNYFMLLGPNTGLGHTSQVFMIETQARMAAKLLADLRAQGLGRFDLEPEAEDGWSSEVADAMEGTVWSTGNCASWYLDADGRNTTLWPGSTATFWRRARRMGLESFRLTDSGSMDRQLASTR